QAGRVGQSDAVNEVQPHPAPSDHDLADRSLDPAARLGAVVREAAPEDGLPGSRNGAPHGRPQSRDQVPDLRRQTAKEGTHLILPGTVPPGQALVFVAMKRTRSD